MLDRKKYIFWGIICSVVLVATLALYNYVRNRPLFNRNLLLTAEFESISSLRPGSYVLYAGIQVGKVQNIYLNPENNHIMVEFDVMPGVYLPENTYAVAYTPNVLYAARLELRYKNEGKDNFLKSGSIIQGSVGSYLMDVKEQVDPFVKKIDSAVLKLFPNEGSVHQLVKDININIRKVSSGTKSFSELVVNNKDSILLTVSNLNKTISDFNKFEKDLNIIIDNLTKSTIKFKESDFTSQLSKINLDSIKIPDLAESQKKITDIRIKVEKINSNQDSIFSTLVYDHDFKLKISKNIQDIGNKSKDIRLHPENTISIKKKK